MIASCWPLLAVEEASGDPLLELALFLATMLRRVEASSSSVFSARTLSALSGRRCCLPSGDAGLAMVSRLRSLPVLGGGVIGAR